LIYVAPVPYPSAVYTADTTWGYWNNTSLTAASSTNIWNYWNQPINITAGTSIQIIWDQWIGTDAYGQISVQGQPLPPIHPSAEEVERRRLENERRAAEAAEQIKKVEEARRKARAILLENISEEQRAELEKEGHFHVETRDGQRRYRLRPGRPPIRVAGEDGHQWSYCIHPRGNFPADDTTLALKLMLEADEDRFLSTANASRVLNSAR
jgi:hypothetical protein